MGKGRVAGILYWYLVVFLVAFGLLAIASIGLPFLILGVALGLLGPIRNRPRSFWPVLCGIAGFVLGFVLIAPGTCRARLPARIPPQADPSEQVVRCTSLLGIQYSGEEPYRAPIWPAAVTGLGAGAAAATLSRRATNQPVEEAPV